MTAAKEMVDLGLKDRGYEYVNSEQGRGPSSINPTHARQLMTAGPSNLSETLPPSV